MKFSAREDIAVPIETVFTHVSDFGAFERQALRRGAEVKRIGTGQVPDVGAGWQVDFSFRGRARSVQLLINQYDPPQGIVTDVASGGLVGQITVDLVALSPQRTRLAMAIDLSPKTLSARLLLQSLKLAKTNLTNRFKSRVADFAAGIEERHGTGTGA